MSCSASAGRSTQLFVAGVKRATALMTTCEFTTPSAPPHTMTLPLARRVAEWPVRWRLIVVAVVFVVGVVASNRVVAERGEDPQVVVIDDDDFLGAAHRNRSCPKSLKFLAPLLRDVKLMTALFKIKSQHTAA